MTPAFAYANVLTGAVPDTVLAYPSEPVAVALAMLGVACLAAILLACETGARSWRPAPRRPHLHLVAPRLPTR